MNDKEALLEIYKKMNEKKAGDIGPDEFYYQVARIMELSDWWSQ